jgi:hypothetical protein
LDSKAYLSIVKRTKIKQGCFIIKKEGNLKNVAITDKSMLATNINSIRKDKNINFGHSPCPSKRYRCLNEMSKC